MENTNSEKFQLPIKVAKDFRTATVDSAVINQYFDGLGTTVKLIFTRMDTALVSESMEADVGPGSVTQRGPSDFQMEVHKVQEFAALMRPDHAYQLAKALLLNLSRLDDGQKQRYNLPEIQPLIENRIQGEGKTEQ